VARRRFQRGSVYLSKARTVWLGMYSEYVLDPNGVEQRRRRQVILGPVRKASGEEMRKKEAQRLLQPYVDRVNSSISNLTRECKSLTFEAFAVIWERDYLCQKKPSTQATMRGHLKRLKKFFGQVDIRQIGAADLQRLIADMQKGGKHAPKTIKNLWVTVRLIWSAALDQGYVDRVLPKPGLPKAFKRKPRYFHLNDVARIIVASEAENRCFYWLAAETGLRAGELAGLTIGSVTHHGLVVDQSVWNGVADTPKTQSALRTLAISPQLAIMLLVHGKRQLDRGHKYLFSNSKGSPLDMNTFRTRKMLPLLRSLDIKQAGYHAFRHFNASFLNALRVPLKTIQERLGHAFAGSLTLDVYTHSEWKENYEAARLLGESIEKAVNSVNVSAIQQKGLPVGAPEALEAA